MVESHPWEKLKGKLPPEPGADDGKHEDLGIPGPAEDHPEREDDEPTVVNDDG